MSGDNKQCGLCHLKFADPRSKNYCMACINACKVDYWICSRCEVVGFSIYNRGWFCEDCLRRTSDEKQQ